MQQISDNAMKKQWAFVQAVYVMRKMQCKRDKATNSLDRHKYGNSAELLESKVDALIEEVYKHNPDQRPKKENIKQTSIEEWLAR